MLKGVSLCYVLNEAAAIPGGNTSPAITIDTGSPARNDLKLALVNATGADQPFLPAPAPSAPGQGSGSTLYLQITEQAPAENNAVQLAAVSAEDWAIAGFDEVIGLCPRKPFVLDKAHDATNPYFIHLTNIAVAHGNAAGILQLDETNCPAALNWLPSLQNIAYTHAGTPLPAGFYGLDLLDAATAGPLLNITAIAEANRLTLTLTNRDTALKADQGAAFDLTFSYGPWEDDIAPESLFDHVAIAPQDTSWSCRKIANTGWRLEPPTGIFLAANAEYRFLITGLITQTDPVQDGNVCFITIRNQGIEGYSDGGVQLALTKGYYATIATFVLESRYEGDNNKHDICTGIGTCRFFAGDTVDLSWKTCGSDPTAAAPCTLLLGAETIHAGAAQDIWSWAPPASQQQQLTLCCAGKGAAGAFMKRVGLSTKPPEIHAFSGMPYSPGSAVIRLDWLVRGVRMKITLTGTGIPAPIDVTALTLPVGGDDQMLGGSYVPPTTTGYPDGNYAFTLTCDDGFNPPQQLNCTGPAVALTDITTVAYPIAGGIAAWQPGGNPIPHLSPNDPSTVTDITVNMLQREYAGEPIQQFMIAWSSGAGQVNAIYAGPGSTPIPFFSASYAKAGQVLCSLTYDLNGNPVLLYQSQQKPATLAFEGLGLPFTTLNMVSQLPAARIRHLPTINGCLGTITPHNLIDNYCVFTDGSTGSISNFNGIYAFNGSNPSSSVIDMAGGPISGTWYALIEHEAGKDYSIIWNRFDFNGQAYTTTVCKHLTQCDDRIMSLTLDAGLTVTTLTQKYLYWLEKIPGQTEHMLCRVIKEGGSREEIAVLASDPASSGLAVVGILSN